MRRGPMYSLLLLLPLLAAGCSSDPASPGGQDEPTDTTEPGYLFTYSPPDAAPIISSMSVRGSFNEWGETPMLRRTDGTGWQAEVDLPDGTHAYKFYINGEWIPDMCYDTTWGDPATGYMVDPDAAGCVPDGNGGQNAVVVLGDVALDFRHSPGSPVDVSSAAGVLSVRFRVHSGVATGARVIADGDTAVAARQMMAGVDAVWRASVPEGAASYTIEVETADSTAVFGPFEPPAEPFTAVPWVEDAVGYQIFPERFWNGDPSNDSAALATDEYYFSDVSTTPPSLTTDWSGPVLSTHCCHQYFGGDLQGIMDKLDYLQGQGVDVLYLNPIFLSGSAHGYDTYDYRLVAPNFGDSTTLRSLVDQLHARGMRVIWDFVPNHVGIGHWAFRDALQNGEASDYWDWFTFYVPADSIQAGDGNDYAAWWGFGSLPELRTQNPDVLDHLMAVAEGWTEFGLDGIRVDVPGEIDNRSQFFTTFRQTTKAVNPDVYLVGEIWERDPSWLQGDQFDALMNYAMGRDVVEAFARGDMPGVVAARQMAALYSAYPEAAVAMEFNLISSHDTSRLLTLMGGGELGDSPSAEALARQRLAAAFLFALPGVPITFQGDECAQLGGSEGFHTARYPVQWDSCDPDMSAYYAGLADLKHSVAALASPVIRADTATVPLVAFYRGEPGPGEVLAVFNNTSGAETLDLPAGSWTDADSGESVSGSVSVAGYGWRYLVRGG